MMLEIENSPKRKYYSDFKSGRTNALPIQCISARLEFLSRVATPDCERPVAVMDKAA